MLKDLRSKFRERIRTDRYNSRKAPLFIASISKFRYSFFQYFHILETSSSSSGNIEGDDENFEDEDDEETAEQKAIREESEKVEDETFRGRY